MSAESNTSREKRDATDIDHLPIIVPVLRPPSQQRPFKKRRSRSTSPTKRADVRRTELETFAKPIFIRALSRHVKSLPDDVKDLYKECQAAASKEGIIPHEVKAQFIEIDGEDEAREKCFRKEDTVDALSEFETLSWLQQEAEVATAEEYYEDAWNGHVHTPLLKTIFCTLPSRDSGQTRTRMVSAMSVGILNAYLPGNFADATTNFSAPESASSISGSEVTATTATRAGSVVTEAKVSATKRIDYVLCLDSPEGAPLRNVLESIVKGENIDQLVPQPHINHVLYPPLRYAPIAVSIETKVAAADALPQLGTWLAAWHDRMRSHRTYLAEFLGVVDGDAGAKMPTVLLLEVSRHNWSLYFACDRGASTDLVGPLSLAARPP